MITHICPICKPLLSESPVIFPGDKSSLIYYFIFGTVFIARICYDSTTNSKEVFLMKQKISTKRIVLAALMAALTVVGSAIRVTIPVDIGGTTAFHLGNIMCALSGLLLGPGLGGVAAGLGSAIYDMMNPAYISEAWLTFLMKGAYGFMAGLAAWASNKHWGYFKATAASCAGALTYALLYLGKTYYKARFLQGVVHTAALVAAAGKLPATIFNAAVAIIFAPMLGIAIRKALEKNRLTLD